MSPALDPAPRAYLPLLDPLRILASFSVVYVHMRSEFLFGVGFGLPVFLVIMFALSASSRSGGSLAGFARRKARHLLVPWVRWSAIYVGVLIARDVASGQPALGGLRASMLIEGGHPALWFLPFACVALVATRAAASATRGLVGAPAALAWSGIAVITTSVTAAAMTGAPPLEGWLRMAPSLCWGLALAACARVADDAERRRLLLVVALLAVAGWWLAPPRDHGEDVPLRFAAGVPLACVGFAWRVRMPSAVRVVAGHTFGIYVMHALVAKALTYACDPFAWPSAVHALVVWSLTAAGVHAVRRSRLRWHECEAPGGAAPRPAITPAQPARDHALAA